MSLSAKCSERLQCEEKWVPTKPNFGKASVKYQQKSPEQPEQAPVIPYFQQEGSGEAFTKSSQDFTVRWCVQQTSWCCTCQQAVQAPEKGKWSLRKAIWNLRPFIFERGRQLWSLASGLSELINIPLIPFDSCHLSTGPQMAKCRERSWCQCHSQAGAQRKPALLAPAPPFQYTPEECKLKTLKKIFCNQKAIFNLNWPEHSMWSVILSRQMLYARTPAPRS